MGKTFLAFDLNTPQQYSKQGFTTAMGAVCLDSDNSKKKKKKRAGEVMQGVWQGCVVQCYCDEQSVRCSVQRNCCQL